MRVILAFLLLCGSAEAQTWSILNRTASVRVDAGGKSFFDWPRIKPGPNYLTTNVKGLKGTGIGLAYTIQTQGTPFFDWRTKSNNTCQDTGGKIRLFIQRQGDNMSMRGAYAQYRYWATEGFRYLSSGSWTVQAVFDPAKWTDTLGQPGTKYPDRFRQAIAYAGKVGVTFGGGCFFGHGVWVTGGQARMTVDAFVKE